MDSEFDLAVVGSGAAGLSAGFFGARNGRSTIVFTGAQIGGHLTSVGKIEDYPGFPEGVAGYDLTPMMQEQAEAAGAVFSATTVRSLARCGSRWTVSTDDAEYGATAVIAAMGAQIKQLGIPGEDRLRNRGVSNCATCDGPIHRGQVVAVVGGGDSALLEALELTGHAARVLVVHTGASFDAQETYRRRVEGSDKIEVHPHTVVDEILGEDVVSAVLMRTGTRGNPVEVQVSGVFVYVGLQPRTSLLAEHLPLDVDGRVPTDSALRTALPGLLAAGDVRRHFSGQAITAAGDGAAAAAAAESYLRGTVWPDL